MRGDTHEQARKLIAGGGGNDLSAAEQIWLRSHVEECAACRDYAEAAEQLVLGLRSVNIVADSRLVRATKMRVRFEASRLAEARERIWLVAMAGLGVGLSATVTLPLMWRLFAWMGEQVGLSDPAWHVGFLVFGIAPALLVSLILLVRDTFHANHGGHTRQ